MAQWLVGGKLVLGDVEALLEHQKLGEPITQVDGSELSARQQRMFEQLAESEVCAF